MITKSTKKTRCLKALLLRAWRQRWTDLQWGIHIKKVLPTGVSGDVYNLADCILQQAVIGSGANPLVLSYLRYSLNSRLVSHTAVLQSLSKYNHFGKVHCISSLLEFLEEMLPCVTVTCHGKPEETILASTVLQVALWLLNILQQSQSTPVVIQKAKKLFQTLLTDDFYIAMIFLAKCYDTELFNETNIKCMEILAVLTGTDKLLSYVRRLHSIAIVIPGLPEDNEEWPGCLIQCWLEVKLVGNPAILTSELAQQLQVLQRVKRFSDSRLYAELMRGSLLALYNVGQTSFEYQWGAFTFLNVPRILLELAGMSGKARVVKAVELMLQHSPLFDALDANSSGSNLKCLLHELAKLKLLEKSQVNYLLEKRKPIISVKIDTAAASTGMPMAIIFAKSTITAILKAFSTNYHKSHNAIDDLHELFSRILTGKKFKLILAVATGQLHTFVNRLIEINERYKFRKDQPTSQLFDITFLMLVSIVQHYGTTVVLDSKRKSFFHQWVCSCMMEKHTLKGPEQLLKLGLPRIVEYLLQQFNVEKPDFKGLSWQDIILNIPGVMREVLVAWERGVLTASDVKRILDAVKEKMCCFSVAGATWLYAYMQTAPPNALLKPCNMIEQLLASSVTEDDSLCNRRQLAYEIVRKMQRDIQLPHDLVSARPAIEQLDSVWSNGMLHGWLGHSSAKTLHCLFETAGPRWLVSAVIQELLKLNLQDQLQRGVDLALAVFHVDIEGCTSQLLSQVLPQLIYNDLLTEPQLPALAKLVSYCVYAAFDALAEDDNAKAHLSYSMEETKPQYILISLLRQILNILESIIQKGYITQQTYFAFYLLKSLVEVKLKSVDVILAVIPPSLISDLLKTLPELFNYSLLTQLHSASTMSGGVNMAKDLCILRNYHLKKCSV